MHCTFDGDGGSKLQTRSCLFCIFSIIVSKMHFFKCFPYVLGHFFYSDFIWDFGKLPFSLHLGKYIIKNGKISTKIHEIGKIKANF